jgi:VWFA-related protein
MDLPRRSFLSLSAAAVVCRLTRAQDQDATFSSDVRVVNLLAAVRDKKGEIVRDLTKDDFALLENGRPQTIRYFSRESDLPLTLGLMVDTSMSQQRVLDAERGASFRFIDQVLRENKDQVFIVQFDGTVRTAQSLTSSRAKLKQSLTYVDTPTRRQLQNGLGDGTLLYDAVVSASDEFMKSRKGRKALIVLSDGVDNYSDASLPDSIEAAHRADTLIYSILFSDSGFPSDGRDGKGVLARLAKETGGEIYEVSKKLSIDRIFDLIQEDLRSQYSLGYVSDRPVTVSEFRKVQLTVKRPGLVVQSRDRYWAEAPAH